MLNILSQISKLLFSYSVIINGCIECDKALLQKLNQDEEASVICVFGKYLSISEC